MHWAGLIQVICNLKWMYVLKCDIFLIDLDLLFGRFELYVGRVGKVFRLVEPSNGG